MMNYKVAEAKGLFARLIPNKDLFTNEIYETVEISRARGICVIALR